MGPKSQSGGDGYLRPDQFLDHLTVIIIVLCVVVISNYQKILFKILFTSAIPWLCQPDLLFFFFFSQALKHWILFGLISFFIFLADWPYACLLAIFLIVVNIASTLSPGPTMISSSLILVSRSLSNYYIFFAHITIIPHWWVLCGSAYNYQQSCSCRINIVTIINNIIGTNTSLMGLVWVCLQGSSWLPVS